MSVIIQNQAPNVDFINIVHPTSKTLDVATVQPGGKVTLPRGWRVASTWRSKPHIIITGNDAPVSPLDKE